MPGTGRETDMTAGPTPTLGNGSHLIAGAAPPTLDDPTAGGILCGCRRRAKQVEQDREAGIEHPWPFCQRRAGTGTDHPGIGQCHTHGGNSPSGRRSAQLRYAELQNAVVEGFYRVMVDPKAKTADRLRAMENLADRGGSPRRTEVDVETARRTLLERLLALQSSDAATS